MWKFYLFEAVIIFIVSAAWASLISKNKPDEDEKEWP